MTNFLRRKKGFTLLELMIAIFIISIGIIGVFILIQNSIESTRTARSRLVAAYLAQEGLELTKNVRDTNWVQGGDNWQAGTYCPIDGCKVAYNTSLGDHDGQPLLINSEGFYGDIGDNSRFKREIFVVGISGEEIQVEVVVSWEERSKEHELRVIGHLYNWLTGI